jgi:hypothetical protein
VKKCGRHPDSGIPDLQNGWKRSNRRVESEYSKSTKVFSSRKVEKKESVSTRINDLAQGKKKSTVETADANDCLLYEKFFSLCLYHKNKYV